MYRWLLSISTLVLFIAVACSDDDDEPRPGDIDEDCDSMVEESGGTCIFCLGEHDVCAVGYACFDTHCAESFCLADGGCEISGYECIRDADGDGVNDTCLPPDPG